MNEAITLAFAVAVPFLLLGLLLWLARLEETLGEGLAVKAPAAAGPASVTTGAPTVVAEPVPATAAAA